MVTWWVHLSFSHAALALLLVVLAAGYVLTDSVEDPRAWRFLRRVSRLARRYVRRLRPVQATRWDGAIVLSIPLTGWSLAWLGAVRAWVLASLHTVARVLTAPWRGLCAWITERRLRKLVASAPDYSVHIADYSAKRARAVQQLGDDYLLAHPLKRRTLQ